MTNPTLDGLRITFYSWAIRLLNNIIRIRNTLFIMWDILFQGSSQLQLNTELAH